MHRLSIPSEMLPAGGAERNPALGGDDYRICGGPSAAETRGFEEPPVDR